MVRRLLAVSATVNFFNCVFFAVFVLFAVTQLGIGPASLGLVIGIGASGALVGSIVAEPLTRRLGIGMTVQSVGNLGSECRCRRPVDTGLTDRGLLVSHHMDGCGFGRPVVGR